jgi:hypothetical protein
MDSLKDQKITQVPTRLKWWRWKVSCVWLQICSWIGSIHTTAVQCKKKKKKSLPWGVETRTRGVLLKPPNQLSYRPFRHFSTWPHPIYFWSPHLRSGRRQPWIQLIPTSFEPPPPLSFHASTPSFKLSKLVKACWAVALIHPSSSTAPTIHRPSLQITDPRPTLAAVNGQRRLPNPRQRTYLPTASPPTPSSWIFPED